jgi:flagellar P-ring protein precursor FlgI
MRRWQIHFAAWALVAVLAASRASGQSSGQSEDHKVLIRDVASVEGIRNNSLIGYGLVVGLKGTGDKQQTFFTIQTLASILQRMGVEIPPSVVQSTVQVKNVAAVFVTASLPPFARPGMPLDVLVSSAGDARSLEGGLLLLTPLYAADGQVYAAAQGPLVVGGYAVGSAANAKSVNHPTVGRIPNGGLIERDSSLDLTKLQHLSLLLNDASFTTVEEVAAVINHELATPAATVVDSRRVEIKTPPPDAGNIPALLARIENLEVRVRRKAKVVVNERTGTVVLGKDVRLGAVSILHGSFSIEVTTTYAASQPNALAGGQTEVLPETRLKATESPARNIALNEGASVEDLVTRLQAIGATARDVVSILQAIKAAGALEAELEVI